MSLKMTSTRKTTGSAPVGCRSMDLHVDGFAECLQVGPNSCRYAVPFGYAFLCRQPGHARALSEADGNQRSGPTVAKK